MKPQIFPMRQVHLDFHTSPDIPDVGTDWDAQHFVETLQQAHVNSITVFAKCHHGMNYYPTGRNERFLTNVEKTFKLYFVYGLAYFALPVS